MPLEIMGGPKFSKGLNPAQKVALESIAKNETTYLVGGWGSGKTTLACYAVALHALRWRPGWNGLCLAPTFDMMRDLVVSRLKELVPPSILEVKTHGTGELGPHLVFTRPNPGRSPVRTLVRLRVEAAAEKVDGFDTSFVYCEEAQACPSVWARSMGRLRGYGSYRRAWLVGIPEAGWLETLKRERFAESDYHEETRSQWLGISTRDNLHLEGLADFIAHLRKGMTQEQASMLIDGLFSRHSDSVYPSFSELVHVGDFAPPSPHDCVLVGVDFNNDPMTAVLAYKDAAGRIIVFDEVSQPGTTYDHGLRIVEKIRAYGCAIDRARVYPDPAGKARNHSGTSDFAMLSAAGLTIYPRPAHSTIAERDNAVNFALRNAEGRASLLFDRRCRLTIDATSTLRHSKRKTEGKDHLTDSLGYLVQQETGAPFVEAQAPTAPRRAQRGAARLTPGRW